MRKTSETGFQLEFTHLERDRRKRESRRKIILPINYHLVVRRHDCCHKKKTRADTRDEKKTCIY